jgi:ribosomal protein S18 acetylase RimI-like enzyme
MNATDYQITPMTMADYEEMLALWRGIPGIGLSQADEAEPIGRFIERNPGFCFVARKGGQLVGTILGGYDGRRGYLHHVAVDPGCRYQGIGRALVEKTIDAFKSVGIQKAHLFVYRENETGQDFWRANGWYERHELTIFSRDIDILES